MLFRSLHQIFFNYNAALAPQLAAGYTGVVILIAIGYALHFVPARADAAARRLVVRSPLAVQVLLAAAMIWLVMQVKSSDIQPFIYFQF